jgi:hypothetical protein
MTIDKQRIYAERNSTDIVWNLGDRINENNSLDATDCLLVALAVSVVRLI